MAKKKTSTKKVVKKRKTIKKLSHNQNKKILPVLITFLKSARGQGKAVNHYWIKSHLLTKLGVNVPKRVTSKLIHHLRVTGAIKKLVSDSNGFYIATTKADGDAYIRRISGYIKEMTEVRTALKKQFNAK